MITCALPVPASIWVPAGSLSRGWVVAVYVFDHKPTELSHSFLFCFCVYFCLYGPFNCISFHKFSRQLSAFSLCSSGLISALLVLSTIYLFMKVSLSPDIILCGWLSLKHRLSNLQYEEKLEVAWGKVWTIGCVGESLEILLI